MRVQINVGVFSQLAIWYGKAQSIHSDRQPFERDSALTDQGTPE